MKTLPFSAAHHFRGQIGATAHPEVLQGVISVTPCAKFRRHARALERDKTGPAAHRREAAPAGQPSKIVCLGRNYVEHAAEFNNPTPKQPLIFLKPPSSLLAPDDPWSCLRLLGAWILKRACCHHFEKNVPSCETATMSGPTLPVHVPDDVSAREYQALDKQWTRAKSFDTFCPLGPVSKPNSTLPPAPWKPC